MKDVKAVSLISSGIDSPVATWMMLQRGVDVIGIHYSSAPVDCSKGKDLTIRMAKKIGLKRLYIVDYGPVQQQIAKKCRNSLVCVLCKRLMIQIAEALAKKECCQTIITGDNLGQVASQTLENMVVISQATSLPILRPILCNDKQETVNLAKEIGTYDIGLDSPPCCGFVPKQPATRSIVPVVRSEEDRLDKVEIIRTALENAEVMEF